MQNRSQRAVSENAEERNVCDPLTKILAGSKSRADGFPFLLVRGLTDSRMPYHERRIFIEPGTQCDFTASAPFRSFLNRDRSQISEELRLFGARGKPGLQ